MYASVIVDVPARQTNRSFDYRIPEAMAPWVKVGCRVGVPFGSRVLQGFVIGIEAETAQQPDRIKSIVQLLDLYPALTESLVQLGLWMGKRYVCPDIIALQAMLPSALKAKYEQWVTLCEAQESSVVIQSEWLNPLQQQLLDELKAKGKLSLDALLQRYPSVSEWIREQLQGGVLQLVQQVRDQANVKTQIMVKPASSERSLDDCFALLPRNAKRQKEIIEAVYAQAEPVPLASLLRDLGVSASSVKSLADKGLLLLEEQVVFRDPFAHRTFERTVPLQLTEQQHAVFRRIEGVIDERRHEVFLLKGVTGSGKTEIYLQAIQQCLDQQREAVVLVPEISLTPQMVERFKGRFGDQVAVMHSRLSTGERYDEWRKIHQKEVTVVIGARSAVFAPFQRLGLIIIDEEHESSYKQEDSPKYDAREVAIHRAALSNGVVILGSATPSLESYYMATEGEAPHYTLLTMNERVEGRPMPPVHIVDMRQELKEGNRSMFSRALHQGLEQRLAKGEQSVLLLNRRGYSTFVMCRSCGCTLECPHCDIALTYHQTTRMVRCHYCGHSEKQPEQCPKCESEHIRYFGTGTQRVEEELVKLFPGIRVIRMDVDTTTEKGSHEKWLSMFGRRQADVLLGTQMVAKGLDFPYVTLVGVIAADTVLHLPDFRAAERTFQLLTQVAGRAGRHHLPGEVVVQTYTPEHYSIMHAAGHDYDAFVRTELDSRYHCGYPPYCRLIHITFSHEALPLLIRSAEAFAMRVKERTGQAGMGQVEVLGPVPSPIARIKDRYRYRCVVKYQGEHGMISMLQDIADQFADVVRKEKLQISIDVDPQLLM